MRVIVTGASGYIGGKLAQRLLGDRRLGEASFVLADTVAPSIDDPRVEILTADLLDPDARSAMLIGGADIVFHMAGILGGAAETDYMAGRAVNIDASLALLEELRNEQAPPRVVYASTIAVFGAPLPDLVDDDTIPLPEMNYGAQKLVMETIIGQFSRRGWIDGIAVRLPGIVARPDADARLKSAFMNSVFHDYAAGRPIVLPVSPHATLWLISVDTAIDALIHASFLPPGSLGRQRSVTLPAQHIRMDELIGALARRFPNSESVVDYAPDPYLHAQFGSLPPLTTTLGDALGFQHDGDLDMLVERALNA